MVQRVQSIYLLMTMLLMAVLCFFSLFDFSGGVDQIIYNFTTSGIEFEETISPTWGVLVVAALGALVPLINIFLFKNRKLQIKLCHLTTFLIVFLYITTAAYLYAFTNGIGIDISTISISPNFAVVVPVIALIFNILAIGGIKKDEKKVRSLDRIR